MKEYKLSDPMNWKTFTEMPEDLQKQYILNMRLKYSATDAMLAEMFDVHFSTVAAKRKALGVLTKMPRSTVSVVAEREKAWQEFFKGPETEVTDAEAIFPDEPVMLEPTHERVIDMPTELERIKTENDLRMCDLTATFRGEFNSVKFMLWLSKLPMPTGDVQIRIEVTGE
jgi:hypothetical protein